MKRRAWYLAFLAVNNWPATIFAGFAAASFTVALTVADGSPTALVTAAGFTVVDTALVAALMCGTRIGGDSLRDGVLALADDLADRAGMTRGEQEQAAEAEAARKGITP